MKNQSTDSLRQNPSQPGPETMETAWQAAATEFHNNRNLHGLHIKKSKSSVIQWLWPLAAVAIIAILCAIILTPPSQKHDPKPHNQAPDITQIFHQGQQLFGNRLHAVTISKDKIVWHLNETADSHQQSDQLVTVALRQPKQSDLYIATTPGIPIELQYQGESHTVEFLPNVSNNIIAVGEGIYWDTEDPLSPMKQPQLHTITQAPH
jgi:hypothetical protein